MYKLRHPVIPCHIQPIIPIYHHYYIRNIYIYTHKEQAAQAFLGIGCGFSQLNQSIDYYDGHVEIDNLEGTPQAVETRGKHLEVGYIPYYNII